MSRQVLRIHDVPTWQGAGVRQVIATISPGSQTPEITGRMSRTGMNIARLNFSHGEFIGHGKSLRTSGRPRPRAFGHGEEPNHQLGHSVVIIHQTMRREKCYLEQ
jgi:Pyruvate kinase, barrel domain